MLPRDPCKLTKVTTELKRRGEIKPANEGPKSRGYSYIEVWFIGMQIPILVGILEYALLLTQKKYFASQKSNLFKVTSERDQNEKSESYETEKKIDKWTFLGCSVFISIFIIIYCIPHI